jgi:proton glutamate symport protein
LRSTRADKFLLSVVAVCYISGLTLLVFGTPRAEERFFSLSPGLRLFSLTLWVVWTLRRRSLTAWIFWSMLAGLEVGLDAPTFALHLRIFSDIFLRLIEMVVAPLILGVLITGIGKHASSREIGRLALKSLVYFEVLTTVALVIGLVAINISKAGSSLANTHSINPHVGLANSGSGLSWEGVMLEAAPENIAKSIAENRILQVAVFAILFGIATAQLEEEKKRPLLAFFESFTAAIFQLTNLIMYLAPLAVGAALAYAVAHSGLGVMLSLGKLVLTLYAAIAAFALLGMFPAALLARVPLRRFLDAVSEPAAIAFATSTSEAALPIAMERMEGMGIPGKIVGFVIPLGYSFNLAGSCLYLSMSAVFLAQAGGIHISLGAALVMLWTMMLASKGIAGIPRAVFVVLAATAASFHLPLDVLPVLLGVDVLMDMGRSTVNVVGNCLASAVIARWENRTGTY